MNKGHFGTIINSSGLSTKRLSFIKRFQLHYIDRGLKFGDLFLSIVERYLIQCPLFGVSVKRDSTVLHTQRTDCTTLLATPHYSLPSHVTSVLIIKLPQYKLPLQSYQPSQHGWDTHHIMPFVPVPLDGEVLQ